MKHNKSRLDLRFWLLLCVMSCCSMMSAQLHINSCVIDSKTGKTLPFATIYINGDKNTISNVEGEFVIDADSTDVLRISYVGYNTLYIPAREVKSKVKLNGEGRTIDEVVVMGTDYVINQVMKRTGKDLRKHKKYKTNFFYRQVSRTGRQCSTFLEAFFMGKSAVQLRDLSLAQGRFVSAVSSLTTNPTNYFTFAEIQVSNDKLERYQANQIVPLVNNYKVYYRTSCQTISDGEKRVYVLSFEPRSEKTWGVKGKLYVDGDTYQLLKYEGEGQKDCVKNGRGDDLRVLPVKYTFVVNYQHDHGFTEVQSVYFEVDFMDENKHYVTNGTMFNVSNRFAVGKGTMKFYDNLYKMVSEKGVDSDFWEKNEIVKLSPLEKEALKIFERDNLMRVY